MKSDLLDVLGNPALQEGLLILTRARPEIGLALQVVSSLIRGWSEKAELNAAVVAINSRAAEHVKRLALGGLSSFERTEVEVRLHELLSVLIKLGEL